MAKKIVSLLCALAMLATMVVVSAFSASAAYTESMAGFTPENTHCVKYGSGSNWNFDGYANPTTVGQPPRFIDTEHFSKGILTIGGSTGTRTVTTGEIGTYSMSAFQIDVDYFTCRSNVAERAVIRVGDLSVYVLQAYDSGAWRNAFTLSATYGADALTLSETTIIPGCLAAYNDGKEGSNMMTAKEVQAEMYAYSQTLDPVTYFQDGEGRSVNQQNKIRLVYENGALTITTPDAITEAGQAWSSTATITGANFENAAVSCELWACAATIKTQMLCNFVGTYAPISSGAAYLAPVGAGLTLDSSEDKNTALSFVYDKAEVDAEFAGRADPYCAAVLDGQNYELPLTTATFNSTEYYVATLEKVTPNLFGTKATCMLTNGYDVIGDAFAYSVKDYCTSMISGSTASAELKAVCANLLVYGEAARVYVGSPADSITDGVDVSAAVTAHADGAAIGASGTGLSFTSATVNMRENVSLVVNVADSAALAGYQLVCQPASGDTYRLTYSAATVSGGVAKYVIPVGIVNAYTEYNVCLMDGADAVSKEYQLSIAGLCTYIKEDVTDSYSAADEALATSILNLATAVAAL